MHKPQIALGGRWKWHSQASRFQNFLGEHAPRPLAARASGARVPPPPPPLILPLLRPCRKEKLFANTNKILKRNLNRKI